jgi:hypothetical protein
MITNAPTAGAPPFGTELRDIKPPLVIPTGLEWLWWTLGMLAALAVLYFVWRWWRQKAALVPVAPPVPAHIRARQKLAAALDLIGQPKPFCVEVSDVTRHYLEERFNFHAPERTTEEFLWELAETSLLAPDQKESLGRFLESCDLVKFARYEPGENELRALHESALRLIDETEPKPPTPAGPAGQTPAVAASN